MIWDVCWWLSVAVLAGAILVAVISAAGNIRKLKPIYVLFCGVFLSGAVLLFPSYADTFQGDFGATLKAIFLSSQNMLQFFTADSDYLTVTHGIPAWLQNAYNFYGAALLILAPVLTFGFLLSFFKETTARLRHILRLPAETYVFSEINPRSVSLAESIRNTNKKAILVFTNAPKGEEDLDDDLFHTMRSIGAILYKNDISLIAIPWLRACKEVSFFALCENEAESINETLQLIKKYKRRANIRIYLFSHSIESELMLNNLDKGLLKIRRVNPIHSLVNHMLSTEGATLFDTATACADGKKEISALVLGVGMLGKEILKSLTWYCQMDGYKFRINGFDRQEDMPDRVTALCPELIDPRYNGVYREGEAYYEIGLHTCDVATESFKKTVRELGNITYAFVALGDDRLNVETAVNLRILFEQMHIHPQIAAFVSDPEKSAALNGAKDKSGRSYDIRFVGDAKTVYSAEVILNSAVEKEALALHMRYNGGDPYGFYEFEYNYKSSMASVIHYEVRKHCGIPGAGKAEAELTDRERDCIEVLEHKRWNAYMRSEGFIYSGSKEKSSRNDMGKMHHNLVVFDDLSDEDKRKDSRVGAR